MKGFFTFLVMIAASAAAQDSTKLAEEATLLSVSKLAAPLPQFARIIPSEKHLRNVRQITFGGQNAEAYLSADGSELIFQSQRDGHDCDAIYRMNIDGSNVRMVSNGRGNTTCSFIAPDGKSIIYASTHLVDSACPPKPDMSRGYVWALYKAYDIFKADPDGSNPVRLTNTDGYDAECVFSPDGSKILFTSVRSGDLEIWMMNADGSNPEQLTHEPGYDGGSFFSADGNSIVWRASRPTGEELTDYQQLLSEGLIRPRKLEIYTMSLADRKPIKLTDNGAANFAPYFHPDGKRIIFCSNVNDPKGRNFDLYLVDVATKQLEQVTFNDSFDGFPMFTRDGKTLVFASNREGKVPGETNIFVADWVD
jgi:Tol biopolymer transport system component